MIWTIHEPLSFGVYCIKQFVSNSSHGISTKDTKLYTFFFGLNQNHY